MKAVVFWRHGDPGVLKEEKVPEPVIGCKEILVRIKACAINHLDIWVRKGISGIKVDFPHILGADIAGTVEDKGKEVQGINIDDKVIVSPGISCGKCERCLEGQDNLCKEYKILGERTQGGYAEFISVPEENILPMPAFLSFEQASCLPLTLLTAWQMARKGEVQAGDTVLITGAGSGVSVMLIQVCKLKGANIIAASSSDEKLKKAEELGADFSINYAKKNLSTEIKDIVKEGVNIVFDHTGMEYWEEIIRSVSWGGKIVICGATSGYKALTDLRYVYFKQLSILGSTMGRKKDLVSAMKFVQNGKIKPVMDRVLPLNEAEKGHRLLEQRKVFGKVVLMV